MNIVKRIQRGELNKEGQNGVDRGRGIRNKRERRERQIEGTVLEYILRGSSLIQALS